MYLKCSTYLNLKGQREEVSQRGMQRISSTLASFLSLLLFLLAAKIGEIFAIELRNVPGEWSCSVKVEAATAAVA